MPDSSEVVEVALVDVSGWDLGDLLACTDPVLLAAVRRLLAGESDGPVCAGFGSALAAT